MIFYVEKKKKKKKKKQLDQVNLEFLMKSVGKKERLAFSV